MSEPRPTNDINLYLAALNAELSVGLRSRSRILEEVGDHLEAAASAEREAMLADPERWGPVVEGDEALAAEARRRAVAGFGSPRETAAGFETGVLGVLDRRLAALDAHVDRWLARPLAWAGAGALGMVALAAAVVALGAFFEVPNADAQLGFTFALTGVLIFCMRAAYVLRGKLPAGGGAALRGLRCKPKAALAFRDYIPFAFFACYASIAFPWDLFESLALWVCLAALAELGGRTASRIRARSAGGSARRPCGPDANWSA